MPFDELFTLDAYDQRELEARNRKRVIREVYSHEQLVDRVITLERQVKEQSKRLSDYSWQLNPDRMGR